MKKDKFIQQKLNEYAGSVRLPQEIIDDAVLEIRRSAPKPAARTSSLKWAFSALAGVAAMAVMLVFAIGIFNNLFRDAPSGDNMSYGFANLGRRSIELSEVAAVDENIPVLGFEEMNARCSLFFDRNTEEAVMVSVTYKVLGQGGADEIILIADLKGGFSELEEFKRLPGDQLGEKTVRFVEIFRNGEYYTNAYFSLEGIDCYLMVMSPARGSGETYLEILLSSPDKTALPAVV